MKKYLLFNPSNRFQFSLAYFSKITCLLAILFSPVIIQAQTSTTSSPAGQYFLAQVEVSQSQAADELAFTIQTTSSMPVGSSFTGYLLSIDLINPLAAGASISYNGSGQQPYAIYYVGGSSPRILVSYGNAGMAWNNGVDLLEIMIDNNGTPLPLEDIMRDGGGMSISDNITTHKVWWVPAQSQSSGGKGSGKRSLEAQPDLFSGPEGGWTSLHYYRLDGSLAFRAEGADLQPQVWRNHLSPGLYIIQAFGRDPEQAMVYKFLAR